MIIIIIISIFIIIIKIHTPVRAFQNVFTKVRS